jgi:hypothetical protein
MRFPAFLVILAAAGASAAPPNPRDLPVGASFTTSQGFSFTLVARSDSGAETWRDERAHLLWNDVETERVARKAAAALCARGGEGKKKAGELPTLEEYAAAERHGFREVLPHMTDRYFWVNSTVPNAPNVGHVFSGNLGRAILITYRSINFENVRCVRREASP